MSLVWWFCVVGVVCCGVVYRSVVLVVRWVVVWLRGLVLVSFLNMAMQMSVVMRMMQRICFSGSVCIVCVFLPSLFFCIWCCVLKISDFFCFVLCFCVYFCCVFLFLEE